MITTELKKRILEALAQRRTKFGGSDAKFAVSIGINNAQYSRIKNGDIDQVISDDKWIELGYKLDVDPRNLKPWNVARTQTYEFIYAQLEFCQKNSASRLFCDVADIGKTFTAKQYKDKNTNVAYVDCSQVKSRQHLIRYIAKEFGVGNIGKYHDVYARLVFYVRTLSNPLIILDEAGDLDYIAFLELKALWNATERACGWYMMGADGLKEKIRRAIDNKKVGYTEMFSRYGNRYQKASPDSDKDLKEFLSEQINLIVKANATNEINIQKLIYGSDYSLRRIYDELRKIA